MCINVDLFIVAMNNCEFIANKPTKYVDLYHINPQLFLRHLYAANPATRHPEKYKFLVLKPRHE